MDRKTDLLLRIRTVCDYSAGNLAAPADLRSLSVQNLEVFYTRCLGWFQEKR